MLKCPPPATLPGRGANPREGAAARSGRSGYRGDPRLRKGQPPGPRRRWCRGWPPRVGGVGTRRGLPSRPMGLRISRHARYRPARPPARRDPDGDPWPSTSAERWSAPGRSVGNDGCASRPGSPPRAVRTGTPTRRSRRRGGAPARPAPVTEHRRSVVCCRPVTATHGHRAQVGLRLAPRGEPATDVPAESGSP